MLSSCFEHTNALVHVPFVRMVITKKFLENCDILGCVASYWDLHLFMISV